MPPASNQPVFTDLLDWLLLMEVNALEPKAMPTKKRWTAVAEKVKGNRLFDPPPTDTTIRKRIIVLLDKYDNKSLGPRSSLDEVKKAEMDTVLGKLSGFRKIQRDNKEANNSCIRPPIANGMQSVPSTSSNDNSGMASPTSTPPITTQLTQKQTYDNEDRIRPMTEDEFMAKRIKLKEEELELRKQANALKRKELDLMADERDMKILNMPSGTKKNRSGRFTFSKRVSGQTNQTGKFQEPKRTAVDASLFQREFQAKRIKLKEEELELKRQALALKKEELQVRKEELALQREKDANDWKEREMRRKDDVDVRNQLVSIIQKQNN